MSTLPPETGYSILFLGSFDSLPLKLTIHRPNRARVGVGKGIVSHRVVGSIHGVRHRHSYIYEATPWDGGPPERHGERETHNPLVEGSSPSGPTNISISYEHLTY